MVLPKMVTVESSAIEAVGYQPADQSLYVRFLSGETYVYFGATREFFREMLSAPSKGKFFAERVRPVFARWRKL